MLFVAKNARAEWQRWVIFDVCAVSRISSLSLIAHDPNHAVSSREYDCEYGYFADLKLS